MVSAMSAKRTAWLLPPGASVALTYPNPAIYLYFTCFHSYLVFHACHSTIHASLLEVQASRVVHA
jgi:hypothetical protein